MAFCDACCARRQVRASIDLLTTPPDVLRKRRAAEHMSKKKREELADAILGVNRGQESRTFVDLLARKSVSCVCFEQTFPV